VDEEVRVIEAALDLYEKATMGQPSPSEKDGEGATPRTDAVDGGRTAFSLDKTPLEAMRELARQLERELAQTCLERNAARNVLARAIERERLANMRATEWEEAAQSAQRALAEQIALAHNLAVDALRGPQSATGRSALNPAAAWPFPDPRDRRLKAALKEWDEQWGDTARNDPYASPWDRELGQALAAADNCNKEKP
jgi:hypothetical protein